MQVRSSRVSIRLFCCSLRKNNEAMNCTVFSNRIITIRYCKMLIFEGCQAKMSTWHSEWIYAAPFAEQTQEQGSEGKVRHITSQP